MTSFIRLAAMAAITAVAVQLTGCANMAMSPPQPTMANATKLRAANMAPVAIGSFKIDPSKAGSDKEMNMRGSNGVHAAGGSFAQYLGDSLKVELQSADLLDPASTTVITGTLTQTELDAGMSTGKGKIAARFVVTRGNAVAYDRELSAESEWESSFIAATAIPLAAQNYEGLYRTLVSKLFDDGAFRTAVAKQ